MRQPLPSAVPARRSDYHAVTRADWPAPDARRRPLQLALGALWLLDAILQFQPAMFTKAFSQMLAAAARGQPQPS